MPTMPLPRSFAALAGANLTAQSAEQLSLAAVPLVAVLALGAGPGEIGMLAAVQTLPFLLLSIPLGLLADRMPRRRVMLASELLRALSLLALLAMVASGHVAIAWLAVLGFLGAVGTVGFTVAAPALVPALVPRELLAPANGRLELARSARRGSPLVRCAGRRDGGLGRGVIGLRAGGRALRRCRRIVVASVRAGAQPGVACAPCVAGDPRRSALVVWRHGFLRPLLLTGVAWNISWFVLQAAYVPYAVRSLGLSTQAVGFTLACYGAGMVLGALLAPRVVGADGVRPRHPARAGGVGAGRDRHGRDPGRAQRRAGGRVVLPVRRWANHLDHHHHHAASERDARRDAGPGRLGVPDRECRRPPGRCGTGRSGGQPVGRAGLPVAGAGRLRAAGRWIILASSLAGLQRLPAPAT